VELARTEYITPMLSAPLLKKREFIILRLPDYSIRRRTPADFA
jgi:hypothetical protein